jgi:hypothetical protein
MSNFKVTREKMHTVIFSDLIEYHSECLQAPAIRSFSKPELKDLNHATTCK